jgi:CheY-like chemotaxis protein
MKRLLDPHRAWESCELGRFLVMIYYNRRILIVDDDLTLLRTLQLFFKDRYQVFVATSARQAMTILENETIQIVLLDILLPDQNGIDLLSEIKNLSPETSVIMLTAVRDVQEVVRAMKAGASHYITKDFDGEELCIMMDRILKNLNRERALVSLKGELESIHNKEMIMGNSPACSGLRDLIYKIADLPSTVLIQGESGTGKELFARAIHLASKNKEAPFITLNLASVPKHLVESELFGHEKGSFTGAHDARKGYFEVTNGGTIFLDEIFQDYVRTARAKGVGEFYVMSKHVLKNAMIPIITNVLMEIPYLYAGSLLLESFFGIPGLGGMTVQALNNSDFPVIKATTVIGSLLYVVFNLISDLAYAIVDPRVKLE